LPNHRRETEPAAARHDRALQTYLPDTMASGTPAERKPPSKPL
jgi:hypothetical protein